MTSNPSRLSSPTLLREYLENLGISPKKSLSQNFLIDGNIIDKIISFAEVGSGKHALEIGPGPGAMTDAMLDRGTDVLAIEKDRTLAKALAEREGSLRVICDDVLKVDLEKELSGNRRTVVANLPYNITSPILTQLLPKTDLFNRIVVMVQLEVAERLTASPGNKTYGSLTVFANLYSQPKWGFKVSRQCFYPSPNVDSAVIRFDLKPPPKEVNDEAFFQLIRTAFGQRRKMMKSSLKKLYPASSLCAALENIGMHETARPEELSADQFVELYRDLI